MKEKLSFCPHLVPVKLPCTQCDNENRTINIEDSLKYTQDGIEKCFERIEKIEELNKQCMDANPLAEIEKKFKKIEDDMNHIPSFAYIDYQITVLREAINVIRASYSKEHSPKQPHKCPVCDGFGGMIVAGVFDQGCNACKGKGIVWG
jgi:hypothetical protein